MAAVGALLCAAVLVAVIVLSAGSSYTLHIVFQNASGLVSGNDVLIGPARVGSVQSVGLTGDGRAEVVIAVADGAAPLHDGTIARIQDTGLAAIAGSYVVLYPGVERCSADPLRRRHPCARCVLRGQPR